MQNIFEIFASCYRGQETCSPDGRRQREVKLGRGRSKRYGQSKQGRQTHATRQRRHREKRITDQPALTHAPSPPAPTQNTNPPSKEPGLTCSVCGQAVHINLQDSPRQATAYRRSVRLTYVIMTAG